MKLVNIRAHNRLYFHDGRRATLESVEARLREHVFNSAPKNIGRELLRRGSIDSFEEWRFWGFPSKDLQFHGLPLNMLHSRDANDLAALEDHVGQTGQPDVIWAEGIHFPDLLSRVFELCPDSLKIVYPKYCEPWLVDRLEAYDACLVDEPWQVTEMRKRRPDVRCKVWDKLVDADEGFFPVPTRKKYDICYVARLHPRKYHKLLFTAAAKVADRRLSVVLVGGDDNLCQQYLEPMARDAGVEATFTGHVATPRVNELINESRIGVLCDKYDAAPRAMLEYMAADVPVLATSEMRAGLRYIGPGAGMVVSPEVFHEGIQSILDDTRRFRPREYLLERYSREAVGDKFLGILNDLTSARSAP